MELTGSLRYPQLWEAVKTSWHRDDQHPDLDEELLHHINHVLMNRFRTERGLAGHLGGLPPAPDVTAHAIQRNITVTVDGAAHEGIAIDTDPHVYAIATVLPDGRILTTVLPRDELEYVKVEFATRTLEAG